MGKETATDVLINQCPTQNCNLSPFSTYTLTMQLKYGNN